MIAPLVLLAYPSPCKPLTLPFWPALSVGWFRSLLTMRLLYGDDSTRVAGAIMTCWWWAGPTGVLRYGCAVYRYREQDQAVGLFACMFFLHRGVPELAPMAPTADSPGNRAELSSGFAAGSHSHTNFGAHGKSRTPSYLLHVPVLLAGLHGVHAWGSQKVPTALLVVTLVAHVMYT